MERVKLNTIKGLEHLKDYYYIQEDGTLYGFRGRKLANSLNRDGYVQNELSTELGPKTFKRHRLVALAFIDNPENKETINHIDENKLNNHVSNLEWATRVENNNHGTRNERASNSNTNGIRSKPVIGTCIKTGKTIEFPSTREAGRQGFDQANVARCCNGQQKAHKGYTWQYN